MSLKPKRLTEQVATCEFTHHAHAHNIIQFWLIWEKRIVQQINCYLLFQLYTSLV